MNEISFHNYTLYSRIHEHVEYFIHFVIYKQYKYVFKTFITFHIGQFHLVLKQITIEFSCRRIQY